ncbi:chromatin protein Cren7 [Vulcanisaeta thermophila]|uniref:chromatin protein Cren7 n=1 Tax=Vulcanisaeta thermophila TaxID=867917 RepID=UPI000852DFD9|nr:chromatin protein Cren7 [Vulcanisaeta thermophila]
MVTLEDLAKREYEIEVEGKKYRLKPTKVWKVQPQGRKGFVTGLFKTPDGKTVRKVIAKLDEHGNIIT